jgi:hypothetical protein
MFGKSSRNVGIFDASSLSQSTCSFTVLELSIDRAGRGRKFKSVVLGEIQAAAETSSLAIVEKSVPFGKKSRMRLVF